MSKIKKSFDKKKVMVLFAIMLLISFVSSSVYAWNYVHNSDGSGGGNFVYYGDETNAITNDFVVGRINQLNTSERSDVQGTLYSNYVYSLAFYFFVIVFCLNISII